MNSTNFIIGMSGYLNQTSRHLLITHQILGPHLWSQLIEFGVQVVQLITSSIVHV